MTSTCDPRPDRDFPGVPRETGIRWIVIFGRLGKAVTSPDCPAAVQYDFLMARTPALDRRAVRAPKRNGPVRQADVPPLKGCTRASVGSFLAARLDLPDLPPIRLSA
jgi:hypothetical protein